MLQHFYYTPISATFNDAILQKVPKPHFWVIFDHFLSFLSKMDFSKNKASNTMLSFRKTFRQIPKKLTDRRPDGPKFIESFQLGLGYKKCLEHLWMRLPSTFPELWMQ